MQQVQQAAREKDPLFSPWYMRQVLQAKAFEVGIVGVCSGQLPGAYRNFDLLS
jgi:hypothetical protein